MPGIYAIFFWGRYPSPSVRGQTAWNFPGLPDLHDLGKSASSECQPSKAVVRFSTTRSMITSLPWTFPSSERIALLGVCLSHQKRITARSPNDFHAHYQTDDFAQIPRTGRLKRCLIFMWRCCKFIYQVQLAGHSRLVLNTISYWTEQANTPSTRRV
jgi:hypothetical protein